MEDKDKRIPKVVFDIELIREDILWGGLGVDEFCPDMVANETAQCKECVLCFYCGTSGGMHSKNTFTQYLVDNGYLTRGQALELTLDLNSKDE